MNYESSCARNKDTISPLSTFHLQRVKDSLKYVISFELIILNSLLFINFFLNYVESTVDNYSSL